jgi:high-affinity iron transporter
LHTLIGYTDQPTAMQLLVYVAVLLVTVVLMRMTGSQPARRIAVARLKSSAR